MRIKEFLKSIEGLSLSTRQAYEKTLWLVDSATSGDEPTDEEIYHFLSRYTTSSLHRHKAAIKLYLHFLHPKEAFPFGPRAFPKPRRKLPKIVAASVVQDLMKEAGDADDRMAVRTLFMLGCRISELMAITDTDVTPQGVTVVVKGGETKLKVITPEFYRELSAYAKKKSGRLFPGSYNHYYTLLKVLGRKVGHPEVSPHVLRHARAVDLLNKGMQLPFVQQFLGHALLSTTAIYTELTGGELTNVLTEVENGKGTRGRRSRPPKVLS